MTTEITKNGPKMESKWSLGASGAPKKQILEGFEKRRKKGSGESEKKDPLGLNLTSRGNGKRMLDLIKQCF